MITIKKNDFIEIEFEGKSNGKVFDTTDKEVAKSIGMEVEVKPMVLSVGNHMLLKGFDDSLEGNEVGKKYSIHLTPDKAFGKRNPTMIKVIPIKVFYAQQMNPVVGMTVQLDDYIAKILAVSGGRVTCDFNNPLAGKEVDYEYTVKRVVTDDKEKVDALQEYFFKMKFDFEIKDKKVIFTKQDIKPFVDVFKEKFKEMTGLEFEVTDRPVEKKMDDKKVDAKVEQKKA